MLRIIIGDNGSGKTLLLERKLDALIDHHKTVVSNIRDIKYQGFNMDRVNKIIDDLEEFDIMLDYGDLAVENNKIVFKECSRKYSEYFMNIIALICRKGDYLILDEPEFLLSSVEEIYLSQILTLIADTYKGGYISTYSVYLYDMACNCEYYKAQRGKFRKIKLRSEFFEGFNQF